MYVLMYLIGMLPTFAIAFVTSYLLAVRGEYTFADFDVDDYIGWSATSLLAAAIWPISILSIVCLVFVYFLDRQVLSKKEEEVK